MAMIQFLRGTQAGLDGLQSYVDGALYFTTDTHKIYMGTASGKQEFSAIEVVASMSALPAASAAIKGKFYYAESENVFCFSHEGVWQQVNPDTGATSIEVVGEGNAVTAASYDAATRKITLTKGETFATKAELDVLDAYVGVIPEGYSESNVVAYVNKKAEETLAAAQGGSSETAASVKLALDNYKAATDPRLEALEAVDHSHDNATVLDGITAEKVAEWDAKQVAGDYATKAEAQGYADAKDEAIAAAKAAGDAAQADVDALELKVGEVAEGKTVVGLISDAQTAADDAQTDVDALAAVVGEVTEGKTVVEMIAEAKSEATYDDTALAGRVTAAEGAIDAIEADYLKAADKTELSDAIALKADKSALDEEIERAKAAEKSNADAIALLTNGVDSETIDGVNDLIAYVNEHGTEVTGMKSDIAQNATDIAAEKSRAEGIEAGLRTDVDAIKADYLKNADKEALQDSIDDVAARMTTAEGEIDALQADSHTHANKAELDKIVEGDKAKWDAAEGNAKAYADELDEAMDARMLIVEGKAHEHTNKDELDLIASGDKAKWDEAYAKAHEHANAAELDKIADGDVAKWNAAQANAEATAAAALATARTEISAEIDADVKVVNDALEAYKTSNDAAVVLKANSADVYAKTETYTQDEVDAAIEAAILEANSWGEF